MIESNGSDGRTYIRDGRFTANNRGTQWFSASVAGDVM
jgi:hypothetical protein